MATYRIHRLKAHLRQQFRFAPHVSGEAAVKPRDYEAGEMVEAPSPYSAFFALRDTTAPLELGDLLESGGGLQIFKFVGFEAARWVLPEVKDPPSGDAGPSAAEPSSPASAALQ